MSFQADQAAGPPDPGVVVPIVVVNGARVPWGKVVVRADQW